MIWKDGRWMSEIEIPPADPGCCQWVEVVKAKRSRVVRMYRCGEPAVGDTDYCRKHLAAKEAMNQFLRQQCKAPGTEAPGLPPDPAAEKVMFGPGFPPTFKPDPREPEPEAGEELTFGHNWPPGYDLGCDHD